MRIPAIKATMGWIRISVIIFSFLQEIGEKAFRPPYILSRNRSVAPGLSWVYTTRYHPGRFQPVGVLQPVASAVHFLLLCRKPFTAPCLDIPNIQGRCLPAVQARLSFCPQPFKAHGM